jgi:hypothetical protein
MSLRRYLGAGEGGRYVHGDWRGGSAGVAICSGVWGMQSWVRYPKPQCSPPLAPTSLSPLGQSSIWEGQAEGQLVRVRTGARVAICPQGLSP